MPLALDQSNSGIVKVFIRNAEFANLFTWGGGGVWCSRGSMVVKINKMSSEAGRNFRYTLGTLALGRDLARACEMPIRTSSWQTDLRLEAGDPFEGSVRFRGVKASAPRLPCCLYLVLHCKGTVRTIPDLTSSAH